MIMNDKDIERTIDQIILNEELSSEWNCNLLDLKLSIINKKDSTDKLELIVFFDDYVDDIVRWLKKPRDVIKDKIRKKEFSDIEISYIITNIFLLNRKKGNLNG